ncbi:HAMP domain-containing sensor histidine kinase [Actinocorallia longicatena]|uniref:histidine kinase n=1 Tax=Actinocorallia longicatena TaxID=111803 RepID=A0ABP6Q3Y0_9ACTN
MTGGLRFRLLAAFGALALFTTVATAGIGYLQARRIMLTRVQNSTAVQVRASLDRMAPQIPYPPDQAALTAITRALDDRDTQVAAVFRDLRAETAPGVLERVPVEMRERATWRGLAFQRFELAGTPHLAVGVSVDAWMSGEIGYRPSGLQVFVIKGLLAEETDIENMADSALRIVLVALALAVVLALVAARQVLRPVRELDRTARRMAGGDLRARLDVRGSDELARLAGTFNETAAALEETVTRLSDREAAARRFAADVSHELRTPVAAMTAVTEVLEEEAQNASADLAHAARTVGEETRNLARLVDDLIEISRFDAGVAALTPDSVDVAEAVAGCLRARGWTGRVETDLPAGIRARLDPRRFDVIIANLVGNAAKHGAPPVEVRASVSGGEIVVEVRDHGPGLPPGLDEEVFGRFVKADAARTRSEGSGLGLAIALENARLHGGTITASGAEGGGALFTVRLPVGEVT